MRLVDAPCDGQPPPVMTKRIAMASVFLSADRRNTADGVDWGVAPPQDEHYRVKTSLALRVPVDLLKRIEPIFASGYLGIVGPSTVDEERRMRTYVQPTEAGDPRAAAAPGTDKWLEDHAEALEAYVARTEDRKPRARGRQSEGEAVVGAELFWRYFADDAKLRDNHAVGVPTAPEWLVPESGCTMAGRLYQAKLALCEQTSVTEHKEWLAAQPRVGGNSAR